MQIIECNCLTGLWHLRHLQQLHYRLHTNLQHPLNNNLQHRQHYQANGKTWWTYLLMWWRRSHRRTRRQHKKKNLTSVAPWLRETTD